MGGPATSPIAKMPGALVSMRSLIRMKPRSVSWTPASLSPSSSTLGARPAATSTFSTVRSFFAPPDSTDSVTASFFTVAPDTRAPVMTSSLRFRNLRPERAEDVGEFAPHSAGADHRQRLRRFLQHEHIIRGEHRRTIQLESDLRQSAHARAGADHDGLLRVVLLLLALGALHRHGSAARQAARALEPGDLVLLEEDLHPLGVLLAHSARALHGDAVVERHLLHLHAKVARVLHLMRERRALEQRLGRDAPPEHTGATQSFALHHRGGESELRSANGAHVSRGAATKKDHVECCHGSDHEWGGVDR